MSRLPQSPQPLPSPGSPASRTSRRGRKGKGRAAPPVTVHSAALVCALLLGPFGAFGALALPAQAQPSSQSIAQGRFSGPLFGDVDDLKVGDCFNTDDELKDYEGEDRKAPLSVDVVPCDESHQSEAFAVFDLRGGPYPGDKEIDAMAEEKCAGKALTDYVGADAKLPETMTVYYYAPREGSWSSSDRVITCFLGDTNGPSTGSVRAAGS